MDQIEEIRSKIDIVSFISETLPLKKAGRNFRGTCPFHTEKTPSFMVSPERQIWKCFGCQKGGDIFGYLMELEKIEFGEALRILAKKAGVTLISYRPSGEEAEKDKLYQVNHLASEFYHYLLLKHQIGKKALDYILQRGISKDSLELFKIGYSPPMWDGLYKFLVDKKGYRPEDLEKAGLVVLSSKFNLAYPCLPAGRRQAGVQSSKFYDRFRDRLMFPLMDHRGNVTGFAGRLLGQDVKDLPASRQEAKYVNTPETLIYHKSELLYPLQITKEDIKKENSALVVEGELDAISTFQVGVKNVVAIKGSALTELQARLLKRFTENLVLSLDADSAGDMASRRGIEIADNTGFNVKVVSLEKYKDPDEAAQKDPDFFKTQIKNSQNVYDFFLDSAFKRFRGKTPEEKKKIGEELLPIWSKIEDEIVKDVFIKKLAERLGVNEDSIILRMEKLKTKTPVLNKPQPVLIQKPRREVFEEYYLSLLFQAKKVDILLSDEESSLFNSLIFQKLIKELKKYLADKKKFSSQFFFKDLPAELKEAYDQLYLLDFGENIEDEKWLEIEIKKTKNHLQILAIREEMEETAKKLKNDTSEKKDGVEKKFGELTKKLSQLCLEEKQLAL